MNRRNRDHEAARVRRHLPAITAWYDRREAELARSIRLHSFGLVLVLVGLAVIVASTTAPERWITPALLTALVAMSLWFNRWDRCVALGMYLRDPLLTRAIANPSIVPEDECESWLRLRAEALRDLRIPLRDPN